MRQPEPIADDPVKQLGAIRLFNGLSEETLRTLTRTARGRCVSKGQMIFNQDDPADAVYAVRSGCIALVICTLDGRELVINEMRAGDCFGELSVLTGQSRSTGAVACELSEVIVLPGPSFLAALEAEPALMRRVLDMTALRLQSSTEREQALAFLEAPARLARFLLQMDRRSGEGYVTISQEELARRVGLTRQTVAKTLGNWRRAGWLVTGRGRVMLLDRAALRNIAEASGG